MFSVAPWRGRSVAPWRNSPASPRLRGGSPWRLRLDNATRRRVVPHVAAGAFGLAAQAADNRVRETDFYERVRLRARAEALDPVGHVRAGVTLRQRSGGRLRGGRQDQIGGVRRTPIGGRAAGPVARVERPFTAVEDFVVDLGPRSEARRERQDPAFRALGETAGTRVDVNAAAARPTPVAMNSRRGKRGSDMEASRWADVMPCEDAGWMRDEHAARIWIRAASPS